MFKIGLFVFIVLWLISNCAPLKEKGGFKTATIFSQGGSATTGSSAGSSGATGSAATAGATTAGTGSAATAGATTGSTTSTAGASSAGDTGTPPVGEEFDGSDVEEVGPPPLTRNL